MSDEYKELKEKIEQNKQIEVDDIFPSDNGADWEGIELLVDYITNLQQEIENKNNEIDRLNNIINELENELSKLYEYYYDGMPKALCKHLLDVLKELKGTK